MRRKILTLAVFGAVSAATATLGWAKPAHAEPPAIVVQAGASGLTDLHYSGTDLLQNGDLSVDEVLLTDAAGVSTRASQKPLTSRFDAGQQKTIQTYEWGEVACAYHRHGNRLEVTVSVRNTTADTLSSLHLTLLTLKFPQAPTGWQANYPYLGANRGDPTVEVADFGAGTVAVCNEDVDQPLLVGFPGRQSLTERPVVVCTTNIGFLSPFLDPYLKRAIPAHGSDEFHLSLRFGPVAATAHDLADDLYAKLRHDFPPILRWRDRRPIGSLHLAASETRFHSPTNPRGWFAEPAYDAVTPTGVAAFRQRVLAYADHSVAILKRMNAQGMVTWDLEGEEYPQATTYLGEPRLLAELAPEMDGVANAYFQKFRDAGLRTGLCIRPQKLRLAGEKTEQTELPDDARITQILYDKMAYANKRWGCTLFYVDSNGDPNVPFDPVVFEDLVRKLAASHIDALVMPEHRNTRYYDCTAPYVELRSGHTGTAPAVRWAYPDAFTVDYICDGDFAKYESALTQSVRSGDILMFRAWWDDPENAWVTTVYRDAEK